MSKVLKLKKMGADFWDDETAKSDIGNYRVRTDGFAVQGKDGRAYLMEFGLWRDRKRARRTHKVTGKPLKHTAFDLINRQGLWVDVEYIAGDGFHYGNTIMMNALHEHNYSYTKHDILQAVNQISAERYDAVEIVE